ncbi:putative bifunctional diguanylate cyclase/phosphodiesterase [Vibrio sp. DNB22_10_4]
MKRDNRSVLRRLSPSERQRIFELVESSKSPSNVKSVWGWCAIEGNQLELLYINNYAVPKTNTVSFNDMSERSLKEALAKLLSPVKTSYLRCLYLSSISKQPTGLAFVLSVRSSDGEQQLNSLSYEISSWMTRQGMADSIKRVRQQYQQKLRKSRIDIESLAYNNHQLEKRMLYHLSHDSATGMLNRNGLESALITSLNSVPIVNGDAFISVIFVQFTNGERVQARIGCDGLDDLLKGFEKKVNEVTEQIQHIARISTTELALTTVVPAMNEQYLPTLCKKIATIAKQGFVFKDSEVHLHSYMGVANSFHTQNENQLINNAFHAALACKESGELITFFTQADQQDQKAFNQLEHYLLQAVRNDDLILYFQPKVDIKTQKWIGAEVLLRWKHPVLGEMSNEALIHMAEQNGLIIEVGYFVLSNAMDRASEWIEFAPDFCLSINVSAKQICLPAFANKVMALLDQYELPAHNLELELTESCLVSNFDIAKANINTLETIGVKFALDDFGTGYASFNYLKKLPFSALKIDKEFLSNIVDNSQDKSIFRSITSIAKKLNKQVVVEGVETQAQHLFITKEHCDVGQGFYYAKPMSRDIFESELQKQYPLPDKFIIR